MLHRKTSDQNPADWFGFAEERLRGADILWSSEGVTALGMEALQEAVERFLKGFLIAKGWTLVKTHDLEILINEAKQYENKFASFLPLAVELTEDFFAQHYPGSDMTDFGKNYEGLRQQTSELVELIKSSVPQYFPK